MFSCHKENGRQHEGQNWKRSQFRSGRAGFLVHRLVLVAVNWVATFRHETGSAPPKHRSARFARSLASPCTLSAVTALAVKHASLKREELKDNSQLHTSQLADLAKNDLILARQVYFRLFDLYVSSAEQEKRHVSLMKVFWANLDDRYPAALCLQQTKISSISLWVREIHIFFLLSSKKLAISNKTGKLKRKRNGDWSEGFKERFRFRFVKSKSLNCNFLVFL